MHVHASYKTEVMNEYDGMTHPFQTIGKQSANIPFEFIQSHCTVMEKVISDSQRELTLLKKGVCNIVGFKLNTTHTSANKIAKST